MRILNYAFKFLWDGKGNPRSNGLRGDGNGDPRVGVRCLAVVGGVLRGSFALGDNVAIYFCRHDWIP